MDVRLTKQILLKTAVAYLSLEKEVKRTDIQKYLSGQKFDNSVIENRIRQYLRTKGILDESGRPTSSGNTVKETGMVKEREEGKYRIWYTQEDPYFKNRIFYFQRIEPQTFGAKGEPIEQVNIQFEKDMYCLSTTENDIIHFDINQNTYLSMQREIRNDSIECHWEWKGLQTSYFYFTGKITQPIKENEIDNSKENLPRIISQILPEWDGTRKRYRIPFEHLDNTSRNSFEGAYDQMNAWCGFDVHITALPLEPYNDEEAIQWRNWLVDQTLREKYLHPNDFADTVRAANDKEGFAAYTGALTQASPPAEEYRETITPSKRSDKGAAYWHLAAPSDLNPGIVRNVTINTFQLAQREEISFNDIAAKLGNPGGTVFYYDKFVSTLYQQQKAYCLFNALCKCTNKYLITDMQSAGRSNYLEKTSPEIMQIDLTVISKSGNGWPMHDRYLVFVDDKAELTVWNISSSLDYVRFTKKPEADTKGEVIQSVNFSRVKKEMLHKNLRDYIVAEVNHG